MEYNDEKPEPHSLIEATVFDAKGVMEAIWLSSSSVKESYSSSN